MTCLFSEMAISRYALSKRISTHNEIDQDLGFIIVLIKASYSNGEIMTNIIAWVLKKDLFLNLTDKILSNRVTQCDESEITVKNVSFKIPFKSFNTLLIKCIITKIKLISRSSFSDHKIGGS